MDRAYEDDKTRTLASEMGLFLLYLQKRIAKALGSMTRNYTNAVMKLSVIFFV